MAIKVKPGTATPARMEFKVSGGKWRVELTGDLQVGFGLRIIDEETGELVGMATMPEHWGSQWSWNFLPEGEGFYAQQDRPLEGAGPETPEAPEAPKEQLERIVIRLLMGGRRE